VLKPCKFYYFNRNFPSHADKPPSWQLKSECIYAHYKTFSSLSSSYKCLLFTHNHHDENIKSHYVFIESAVCLWQRQFIIETICCFDYRILCKFNYNNGITFVEAVFPLIYCCLTATTTTTTTFNRHDDWYCSAR
jgi:hypothetical protein